MDLLWVAVIILYNLLGMPLPVLSAYISLYIPTTLSTWMLHSTVTFPQWVGTWPMGKATCDDGEFFVACTVLGCKTTYIWKKPEIYWKPYLCKYNVFLSNYCTKEWKVLLPSELSTNFVTYTLHEPIIIFIHICYMIYFLWHWFLFMSLYQIVRIQVSSRYSCGWELEEL